MPSTEEVDSSRRSLSIISEGSSSDGYEPLVFAANGDGPFSTASSYTPVSSPSAMPSSLEGSSINIEDDANCPHVCTTDVYEHDTHSTIRTIIRPLTRSPLARCFSPPASPTPSLKSAASAMNLNGMGCCCSSNTFEEEVDIVEQQRRQELHITVTHRVDESNEERLRAVVHQTAFEHPTSGMSELRSRVVSVSPDN